MFGQKQSAHVWFLPRLINVFNVALCAIKWLKQTNKINNLSICFPKNNTSL